MKDATDITVILDRSGSMRSIKRDTIGGFNSFIEKQRALPGEARMTLVQFDDTYETVYAGIPLDEANPLTESTYEPRGSTALLDAIGRTIQLAGERLAALPEAERPDKVIVAIVTDGEENSSRGFSHEQAMDMIAHQRDVYRWVFLFLGAGMDAIAQAAALGIQRQFALQTKPTRRGTAQAYDSLNFYLGNYRASGRPPGWTDEDREGQD